MDRKSIVVVLISILLMMGWSMMVNKIWPPKPAPPPTNRIATAAAELPTNVPPAVTITNQPVVSTNVEPAQPESLITLERAEARYTFTSHGGGLKLVELTAYPETVNCGKDKDNNEANNMASVNTRAPAPILSMAAANFAARDDEFQLAKKGTGVTASRNFSNGLRVEKEFEPGSNYLVYATVRLQNPTDQPIQLPLTEWTIGTATPTKPGDAQHLGIYWFSGDDTEHIEPTWFDNRKLFGCVPGTPRPLYVAGETNAHWCAVHNQFFTLALAAEEPADQILARPLSLPGYGLGRNDPPSDWLLSTNAVPKPELLANRLIRAQDELSRYLTDRLSPGTRQLLASYPGTGPFTALQPLLDDLNASLSSDRFYSDNRMFFAQLETSSAVRALIQQEPTGNNRLRLHRLLFEAAYAKEVSPSPQGYQASLSYAPTILAPGQTLTRNFQIYAGPREYNTLAKIGKSLNNHLEGIMGYDGFFGFFAKALLLSMNGLHAMGLSYALAIISITVIIKILFWPLTNASTKSMKRMSALQPQMKALQAKYKDDPAKMNRKMMEFMKEHKVSPLGGCLPMLLQLPVFFGFFRMIRSAIELRGAEFLWVCDLSQPDTLFIIPGFGWPFNLLPLLMGATMLWQASMTPPAPGMDPAQQKIMKYMPLMFLVILYNFSAGLTLYWTVQNLLTITQMKLTKARDKDPAAPAPSTKPAAALPLATKKRRKKK